MMLAAADSLLIRMREMAKSRILASADIGGAPAPPRTEVSVTTTAQIIAFAGVILLAAMTPGPDLAIVMRCAALSGRRAGAAVTLGIGTGALVWVTAAVGGASALLVASVTVFTIIKIIGVVYLVFLGVQSLRSALKKAPDSMAESSTGDRITLFWRNYRQGLLCHLLNPKAAVFFMAIIPQFLPNRPAAPIALLVLVTTVVVMTVWFLGVTVTVSAFRTVLIRPSVRRGIEGLMGSVLIGLSIRLATTSHISH
jgi:threonine/homoserine/homoserine lactone efflux protein